MSLLGNHNNDFEKQLKKQLNDTEYKPSESLWDRIDKDVNKPVFEQKVGEKLQQYQVTPSQETWEQIEAQLPPEPNRWKPVGKIWYGLFFLLFSAGITIGYFFTKHQQELKNTQAALAINQEQTNQKPIAQQITKNETIAAKSLGKPTKTINTSAVTDKNLNQYPSNSTYEAGAMPASLAARARKSSLKPSNRIRVTDITTGSQLQMVNQTSSTPLSVAAKPSEQSLALQHAYTAKTALPISNKQPIANYSTPDSTPQIANSNNSVLLALPTSVSKTDNALTPDLSATQVTQALSAVKGADSTNQPSNTIITPSESLGKVITPLDSVTKIIPVQQPALISISIFAGLHMNNMVLKGPSGRDMSSNINLRKQAEQSKSEITAGFLLDYHLNKKWFVSSGIFITNFKMSMSYNTLPTSQSAQREPGASYIHANDTIFNGTMENQGIRYSWNEIPLLVTYRINPAKRLSVEIKTGLSYAIINTVDANIIGYNNVGVLVVKGKEAFPQIGNSIFGHLYAGINYRLNESVSVSMMPYFRYSLNSMVKNENWVQQYPYLTGLSLSLRKQF